VPARITLIDIGVSASGALETPPTVAVSVAGAKGRASTRTSGSTAGLVCVVCAAGLVWAAASGAQALSASAQASASGWRRGAANGGW
jgi:hypothetical protein